MVVYAAATNVSVGRMFLAGVVPGLVAGLMLMGAIYNRRAVKNLPAEPWRGFGEIIARRQGSGLGPVPDHHHSRRHLWRRLHATEAAAVAAVYSFFIAIFIYRDMGPMKGVRWQRKIDSRQARAGFSAIVYGRASSSSG